MPFSCFVNLCKSKEARNQIVLIVDCPAAGKAEAFSQPQHRRETGNRSPRRVEGLVSQDSCSRKTLREVALPSTQPRRTILLLS
jgi:hypothetical protein